VSLDQHRAAAASASLGFAALTVSDRRTPETDASGPLVLERAAAAGHRDAGRCLVPNDPAAIAAALLELLERDAVDAVVVCGGTGLSPRDLTVEAVRPLLERELEGFGELFRALSYQEIGAAAMLSRSTAGVVRGRAVFVVPGSPRAVELAMERLILPEIGHLLAQVGPRG
jgi:molybdenum cofactor biosynthesis protein B